MMVLWDAGTRHMIVVSERHDADAADADYADVCVVLMRMMRMVMVVMLVMLVMMLMRLRLTLGESTSSISRSLLPSGKCRGICLLSGVISSTYHRCDWERSTGTPSPMHARVDGPGYLTHNFRTLLPDPNLYADSLAVTATQHNTTQHNTMAKSS